MAELQQDQAILIFKDLQDLKKAMKHIASMLAVLVKLAEAQQTPLEVKIATREELYHLGTRAEETQEPFEEVTDTVATPPSPSSWRGLFQRKGSA